MAVLTTTPVAGEPYGRVLNPPTDGREVLIACGVTTDRDLRSFVRSIGPELWKEINVDPTRDTLQLLPAKDFGVMLGCWSSYHQRHVDCPAFDEHFVLVVLRGTE